MQETLYRASDAELTREELSELLESSAPEEWLYDEESNSFAYKQNLLICVAPDQDNSFVLFYGHQPAIEVSKRVLSDHFPAQVRQKQMQFNM